MMSHGKLVTIRECQWKLEVKNHAQIQTIIPRILLKDNEATLLAAIENGSVFGFVTCDVRTPLSIIKDREEAGFLFPHIIKRMTIEDAHLSNFMREKFVADERKLGSSPSLIQAYNAEQIFVLTEMVRVWMRIGSKISNITQFVQYVPGKTLLPFVEKVTRMRCEATYENDEAKATTAKLYGNSGM